MFKVFPCGANKIPLIRDWQKLASNDPAQLKLWEQVFQGKLAFWGVPTGSENKIYALDIDVKDANGWDTIRGLKVPPTMTQRTPSGGAHMIYKYPNGGGVYGSRVKFMPGLDTRGEGGYILWYGADNTPINDCPDWIIGATGKMYQQPVGEPARFDPHIAEGIIKTCLETIREASQGERNNTLNVESFKIGQLVAGGTITREYAEQILTMAAQEAGLEPYHIKATIHSGLNGGVKKPLVAPFGAPIANIEIPQQIAPTRWTPTYFSIKDLQNVTNLRKPQLFQDWSTEDIHITTADGGTGKTTLKLFEAVCLALGERFLGFQCLTPGKTLFITGEDTAGKLGAMLGAVCNQMGIFHDDAKLNTVLASIVVKKDSDLCIIVKDKQNFLHPNPIALEKVMQAVADVRPKMIVFDPISSFWGSEAALNDMAKAVSRFMQDLVEKSGACVEMINHMGKVSSANKDMSQFAGRGGTGLPSHARVSRVLRSVDETEYFELTNRQLEPNTTVLMCNVNKFSDGSSLFNKPFLIKRRGYLFERENLEPQKIREENERISDTERIFRYVRECRVGGKYPTQKVIIGHFMTSGDKLSESRVKRALDMLQFNGFEGMYLHLVQGPDLSIRDRVYVVTDADGKEM